MNNIIQILNVVKISGKSKKTGNDYDMRMAQCIIEATDPETGAPAPLIGELVLPEAFKDVLPGRYDVEFEIAVDRDKRVGSRVASMVSIHKGDAARPVAAPAASATGTKG